MYIPPHFEESDIGVLHALIRSQPLGAWVTQGGGELIVNHLPFLLDADRGEHGTLTGHVARANPVWQSFSKDADSVVVFQGAQAYISPSWYPSKHAHGKAVPTWNYAVVHAHGRPRVVDDPQWLLAHVTQLSDAHESTQAVPWSVGDAPPEYIATMLRSIVGIEIPLTRLAGKWKVSQNRSAPDQLGTVAGLRSRATALSAETAALVSQRIRPDE